MENKQYCVQCGKELEDWEKILCSDCEDQIREDK